MSGVIQWQLKSRNQSSATDTLILCILSQPDFVILRLVFRLATDKTAMIGKTLVKKDNRGKLACQHKTAMFGKTLVKKDNRSWALG